MQIERIIVTGAGGFLGSHICQYFGKQGHKVYALGHFKNEVKSSSCYASLESIYDITLPDESLFEIVGELQPTILIHCAGSSSVTESLINPYSDFQKTAGLTAYMLDVIRQVAPECKIIFPSSAAVYGNPKILPVAETTTCSPISPYGFHKMISEKLIEEYSLLYGVSFTILRIFSAYGEGLKKQVMYDLCRKFNEKTTDFVEVYGSGSESRDFIHVTDICKALEYTIKPGVSGIYNLASGRQTRISELAEFIRCYFNSSKSVHYTGQSRSGDPLKWEADINKMSQLGFEITIPLESGLKQYCEWYERNSP